MIGRHLDGTPTVFLSFFMLAGLGLAAFLVARLGSAAGALISLSLVVAFVALFETRLAIYLLIFSMLLSPELALGGAVTAGATLGRGVTFRFDDFLLVIVGLSWLIKSAVHKELGVIRKTPLNGAMLFYISICVFSTMLGMIAGRVQIATGLLFVLKYVQYFGLFFMVINNIEDEKQIRGYWIAVIITALIVGAVGMAQIPGGQRVTAPFEGEDPEPNTLGGYLMFLMLICLALSLTLQQMSRRMIYLCIFGFLFVPFLFTLSRASYLGLIPGLAIVFFLTRRRLSMYLMVAAVLFVLIFPGVLPQAVRERVTYTWEEGSRRGPALMGQQFDPSTSARLASFRHAIEDYPQHPVLGFGVTGWRFIDSQYFRVLLETGALGLLAFGILVYGLFSLGLVFLRQFPDGSFNRGLAIGFMGGLSALLFHAFGSNTFIIVRIMEPFWLVVALLFMAHSLHTEKRAVQPEPA